MSENKTNESAKGKNRSYFNIPDPCTADGSGAMEQVLLAYGQNQPETHWRNHRKHNPYKQDGHQRHYSAQTDGGLVLEDTARNFNSNGKHPIFGIENTPEIKLLNRNYYNKIVIPSMKKRQELRLLNKSGTKSEKQTRISNAEYLHWKEQPDALDAYVIGKNSEVLTTLKLTLESNPSFNEKTVDAFILETITAMAKVEMEKREPKQK